MTTDIFTEVPTFTCNNETLSLDKIVETKTITSVTISYLSKLKKVNAGGFAGKFGFKKTVQEEKEVTITDELGIRLRFMTGNELASIRFWKESEFDKLGDEESYDKDTVFKRKIMTMVSPYEISFHIGNLKRVTWEGK